MTKKKNERVEYLNLLETNGSGRLGATVFQKNNIIRTDKRYIKKYLLKKLAKDRE